MFRFSNPSIKMADAADVSAIVSLLNNSYRGESSRQGWTTEADLIAGETRSDDANVLAVMETAGSVFLKYSDEKNSLIGCVNLQQHGSRLYLGMFSVVPGLQGGGLGKQLLAASEEYARHLGCNTIYMSVISVRAELIAWYQRRGYHDTGERKPFIPDGKYGDHLQPLEFMIMEKALPQH